MAINFNSSDSVNNFFNTSLGMANRNSGDINNVFTSGNLTDYSSIKNGTYKKLLKAYYAKENSGTEREKSEVINNQSISSEAESASGALSDIRKMDFTQDNMTEIQDKVKKFVESYNIVVDKLANSDTKSVLQKGVWMTKAVSSYSGILNKIGISVGSDNRLTLDADKFSNASLEQIENLFKGNMSVGSKISYKINQVESIATSNGTMGYTNKGEKTKYSGVSTFDEYL